MNISHLRLSTFRDSAHAPCTFAKEKQICNPAVHGSSQRPMDFAADSKPPSLWHPNRYTLSIAHWVEKIARIEHGTKARLRLTTQGWTCKAEAESARLSPLADLNRKKSQLEAASLPPYQRWRWEVLANHGRDHVLCQGLLLKTASAFAEAQLTASQPAWNSQASFHQTSVHPLRYLASASRENFFHSVGWVYK